MLLAQPGLAQSSPDTANSITLGIGYNNQDTYRFGQFNGITERGGFTLGGFKLASGVEQEQSWSVESNNLGLHIADFAASYAQAGRFEVYLQGDQLPH